MAYYTVPYVTCSGNALTVNGTLITYDSYQNGLLDLLAGYIDAFCCTAPTMIQLARNADIEDKIKIVGSPLIELKRAIAVSQELLSETLIYFRLNVIYLVCYISNNYDNAKSDLF